MTHFFHPLAEVEATDAALWYEREVPGLGKDFAHELQITIDQIMEAPDCWRQIHKGVRRCFTNRFPYGIVYRVLSDRIEVIAVMHQHRNPDYWKDRLK